MLLRAFALVQLKALRATEQAMEAEWLASVQTTNDIQIALLRTRLESIRLLVSEDSAAMAIATQQIQQNRDLMNARIVQHRDQLISTAEERANVEAAGLIRALAQMQDNLKDILHGISRWSSRLSDPARTMHALTNQASRALASQNAEIDQATTAVTEMSAAVEEVARDTSSTPQAARESSVAAESGNARVGQALDAMQRLTEQVQSTSVQVGGLAGQAQDISQVLNVIGTIAERNLRIATASEEQAHVSREVDRNLISIRDLSVQTSDGNRETVGASEQQSELVGELQRLVRRFKLA